MSPCRISAYSGFSGRLFQDFSNVNEVLNGEQEKNSLFVCEGAQWLSGRVLDSRPRGHGLEPHRRHCIVVLEQDTFILA